jgi:SAM-dependent methyltransferase
LSDRWGSDRGTPIDRRYIEQFLEMHRRDVRGTVLEVKSSAYTQQFGAGAVTRAEVLDIDAENQLASIVADLSAAEGVEGDQFDCFICTQTLQLIYDVRSALFHAHRLLRPGGVLLVTVPTVSRIVNGYGLQTDYWRFTVASCKALFGDVFGPEQVEVHSFGNVLASITFLAGMAVEEIPARKLDTHDDYFPTLIAVRATKRTKSDGDA